MGSAGGLARSRRRVNLAQTYQLLSGVVVISGCVCGLHLRVRRANRARWTVSACALGGVRRSRRGVPHRMMFRGRFLLEALRISILLQALNILCLRYCHGLVDLYTSAVGLAPLAPHPHIHRYVLRHWFGSIQRFPCMAQLLRVLVPNALVCVARGGDLTAELAYGNHTGVAPHAVVVHEIICANIVHV